MSRGVVARGGECEVASGAAAALGLGMQRRECRAERRLLSRNRWKGCRSCRIWVLGDSGTAM
jgi:hypothetical protein